MSGVPCSSEQDEMTAATQLYTFLVDLHRHQATIGARMVFACAGALSCLGGYRDDYRFFREALHCSGADMEAEMVSAPLRKPFDYGVRAIYLLIGLMMTSIGMPLLFELFVP
jgi:hypothetical protein